MMAFGWASVMLCIGVFLRAKIPFLRNMLVPASVIAGVLGILFVNVMGGLNIGIGTDTNMFTTIVNNLFTVSFISISLTSSPKGEGNSAKNTLKGTIGLGIVWCLLYALTPIIAVGLIAIFGKGVGMDSIYGMLIQFAFCQGPGQSAAYGSLFEQFGWANASTVAIAFSAIGFIVAFLVGIPAAKAGVKRGIAKNCGKIDDTILKGYLKKEEQTEVMVKDTTCNSNIETLAFHFAVIGVCYVLAVGIANIDFRLYCHPTAQGKLIYSMDDEAISAFLFPGNKDCIGVGELSNGRVIQLTALCPHIGINLYYGSIDD